MTCYYRTELSNCGNSLYLMSKHDFYVGAEIVIYPHEMVFDNIGGPKLAAGRFKHFRSGYWFAHKVSWSFNYLNWDTVVSALNFIGEHIEDAWSFKIRLWHDGQPCDDSLIFILSVKKIQSSSS